MARYSIAGRSTVVGTTLRAGVSLFAVAATNGKIRQVSVSNTTSTAFVASLVRFTALTNVGADLTENEYDPDGPPPLCLGKAGHTGDGTVGTTIEQASIGAAIGAGYVWTYGDTGLVIPIGTANGIGIACLSGTGQIFDYTIHWDE